MSADLDRKANEILRDVLELDRDNRGPRLDALCGTDSSLRERVEQLFRSMEVTDENDFLQNSLINVASLLATGVPVVPGYEMLERVAHGSEGAVYRARQLSTERTVAIKFLNAVWIQDDRARKRFEREVHLAALLHHPNIIVVHDSGLVQGAFYLVTDFVDGLPLNEYADRKALDLRGRLTLFRKLCDAVQYAHTNNVLHRDMKPSNILVDQRGEPRLLDFGLARRIDDPGQTLVLESGSTAGSPGYMSPEQASGKNLDARSDVYTLGVILYQLLTGQFPYPLEGSTLDVLNHVVHTQPKRPTTLADGARLPREMVTITMRCLEKDRERRYQSAEKLGRDVERYLAGEPVPPEKYRAWYMLRKTIARHRLSFAIAAAFVLVLTGSLITISSYYVQAKAATAKANAESYLGNITAADFALQLKNVFIARRRLAAVPEASRQWEWHYLNAEARPEMLTLSGHQDLVTCVAFSPDGRRIISGSDDSTVKIWDAATGQEITTLRGHEEEVLSVAFSPDGRQIVSGSGDSTLKIWDAATGQELKTLRGFRLEVFSIAFTRDGGQIVGGSSDHTFKLWDAATGKVLTTLRMRGAEAGGMCVAFSPDGRQIVSGGSDKTLKTWKPATGQELNTLRGHKEEVLSVAFSPDGRRIVSGSRDRTLKIWDAASGEELATLRGHEGGVWSVAFSPDGRRIASGSSDQTLKIWDAASGEELATLRGHEGGVRSVAFSPDGRRIVSGSGDHTLKIWDAETRQEPLTQRGYDDEQATGEEPVTSLAFSPDGLRIVSNGRFDQTLKIWDARTGEELTTLIGHEEVVECVAFNSDGRRIISGSEDSTVKIWDVATGQEITTLRGQEGGVNCVAFSPDGRRIISGSDDSTVKIWDAATGQEITTLRGHERVIRSIAFSPDGRRIVSGSDDSTVKIWDVATGQEITTLRGHEGEVWSVAFSPDGRRIISGSDDSTVKIWDAATGQEITTLRGHAGEVWSVAFSPDGRRIISGSEDSTLKIWDVATGQELTTLRGQEDGVHCVAFSPDGRRIASGGADEKLIIWDSAPIFDRVREREEAAAALEQARPLVEKLNVRFTSWSKVAEALHDNKSLSKEVRQQALNEVLRRASSQPTSSSSGVN